MCRRAGTDILKHPGPEQTRHCQVFEKGSAVSQPHAALSRDSGRSPVPQSLAPTPPGTVAELDTIVEERGVTEEEIYVLNEQLASAEETLHAERYWELFEATPAAYLVTDLVGVVREANRRAVALLNERAQRVGAGEKH